MKIVKMRIVSKRYDGKTMCSSNLKQSSKFLFLWQAILGFVAITNTHNTSGDSAQRQSNGRDNIDTIEITDEITDNLVAELEAGPNTTAAETTSTSSIGKYCSCKNPLMTDLRYETESLCQYTHHHLKVKVGSLYGRKCFDCQGSLNEKIAGKMDFLHWCKNCILTDDDGDFLCNFVICPSCHEKRIGELGVQNDSEKRNSRRSRRTHWEGYMNRKLKISAWRGKESTMVLLSVINHILK
jgi:hypothetical protein